MKLSAMLVLVATLHVSARTHAQKVSISGSNLPLGKVFELIKQQTGYAFVADQSVLARVPAVTLHVKEASLEEVLNQCFLHQPLTYTISDKIIVIARKAENTQQLNSYYVPPATAPLTGTVTDEAGQPLTGVAVQLKQQKKATQTNAEGRFEFAALEAGTYVLVFSSVGYGEKEVTVAFKGTAQQVRVTLQQQVNNLNETVVKGYYQTSRRQNTGNVSTVKAEDIARQPVGDPLAALQGRVAGLFISSSSGLPGARFNIRLRGQNSMNLGNDPLVIVDGVPYYTETLTTVTSASGTQSPLSLINPADIERIDVLKDADATAIYGSRGANGVMLITTKKGKTGSTKYNFNVYTGGSKVVNTVPMLNTAQYLELRKEAMANDGTALTDANATDILKWSPDENRNWQDYMMGHTAKLTEATGSVSGGNAQTHFLLSGSYRRESTVLKGNPLYQRGSAHLTADHTSADGKFYISANVSFSRDNDQTLASALSAFYNVAPNYPLYDSTGAYYWFSNEQNPEAYLLRTSRSNTSNLVAGSNLRYTLLPGLQLKANLGYNQSTMNSTQVFPDKTFNPVTSTGSISYFGASNLNSYILEPQVDYTRKLGTGTLQLLAGASWQQSKRDGWRINGADFPSDDLLTDIRSAGTLTPFTSDIDFYRYTALFGRVNYNLSDKYMVNATFRRDGSTRFGPQNRFGNFAAVGAAWVFTNEAFMQQLPLISFGKLRASYGSSGNDQINDYAYLASWRSPGYPYNGTGTLTPTRFDNPYYQWELTRKLEAALELGLLKDRVMLTASFYRNISSNQLVNYTLSPQAGRPSYITNLPAKILNTGWEFDVSTTNIQMKNFTWRSSFNLTIAKNKLQEYPDFEKSSYAKTYVLGQSLTIVKGYQFTGVNTQTGVAEFADLNNDKAYSDPEDMVVLGKTMPDFYGGFQNSFTWKHFQLDFLFQFVQQEGTNINYGGLSYSPGTAYRNQEVSVLNRWKKPGDVTNIPAASATSGKAAYNAYMNYYRYSTAAWGNASYIRLKNLYLKYDLTSCVQKWKLNGLGVFVQAQNLLTFTDYLGFDPETQGQATPPLKTITAGVQLSF
ncbi:TonB-linked SusC/RagA family outer membrane protein [Filimonas zeae]|nr:SusC/RagA family TonB-linked outer membrane protein [Filimonas zeae]MDR6338911.1 TonB-linked SusC/RagA family outer membrane protein [Filimonas zeae]